MVHLSSAVNDFRRARYQAALQDILARLQGRSNELLSYEEVRQKLRATSHLSRGLQEVPLDAIVGSVGRYADFNRNFLPKKDSSEQRWARVLMATMDLTGVPPIDVYQIGDVYFVRDGNHRVSVARGLGLEAMQAYVTEVQTRVPLSPDVQPDDLILMAEYAEFLEITRLDELRPEANLSLTEPGKYPKLLEHIAVHRYFMGIEQEREIPYPEAVAHWYDAVYLPVATMIQEHGVLQDFPERTAADLYLWLADHRAALCEELGWEIGPEEAVLDLVDQRSSRFQKLAARLGAKILDVVTPDELESGPPAGQWRQERLAARHDDRLFADILAPVSGQDVGWLALEQAVAVARREGSRLRGLHVVADEAEAESEEAQKVRDHFNWRCGEVGVPGNLSLEVGTVARSICRRAHWADLVVVNVAHPPADRPLAKLESGLRTMLRRCPRPILTVPGKVSPLNKGLLAYDGGRKADEALFVATYAQCAWQIPLVVATVNEDEAAGAALLERARAYLDEHGAAAQFLNLKGPAAETILAAAAEHECDWLLMGGYNASPVVEVIVGATLDEVLRTTDKPILICR